MWHTLADDIIQLKTAVYDYVTYFATETRKYRRKLPGTLWRLERHQSRNQSVTLSTCCNTVIANNDSICSTDKMTHLVRSNDILRSTVPLDTDLNEVFVKDTLPNDHVVFTCKFEKSPISLEFHLWALITGASFGLRSKTTPLIANVGESGALPCMGQIRSRQFCGKLLAVYAQENASLFLVWPTIA